MLVQFGNNWMRKIPRTAKYGLVQFGSPRNFWNYIYIIILHIQISTIQEQQVNKTMIEKNDRFYTRHIIRLDELGQTFVVRRVMHL